MTLVGWLVNWYAQREGANDSYFLSANRLAMGTYHAMSQFCFSASICDAKAFFMLFSSHFGNLNFGCFFRLSYENIR